MKEWLVKLTAMVGILSVSVLANAQQTQACGKNIPEVKQVMSTMGVFEPNYDQMLMGHYEKFILLVTVDFDITPTTDFWIEGQPYMICPQTDKSFYLYNINNPRENGFARLTDRGIQIYNGHGKLGWAEGVFARTGPAQVAARR